jgi:hypothetical protein
LALNGILQLPLLNIRKGEQYVKKRKPSMITDSNQACMAKMIGRRVQEEIKMDLSPIFAHLTRGNI